MTTTRMRFRIVWGPASDEVLQGLLVHLEHAWDAGYEEAHPGARPMWLAVHHARLKGRRAVLAVHLYCWRRAQMQWPGGDPRVLDAYLHWARLMCTRHGC